MIYEKEQDLDVVDRLRLLLKAKKISRPKLAELTQVSSERWASVVNRKVNVRLDELLEVCKVWPLHQHWLIFGEELPDSGQISPMTDICAKEILDNERKNLLIDHLHDRSLLKHIDSLGFLKEINLPEEGLFSSNVHELIRFYEEVDLMAFSDHLQKESAAKLEGLKKSIRRSVSVEGADVSDEQILALKWLEFVANKITSKLL